MAKPVSHGLSIKSQFSFKGHLESSFNEKFRKTLTKIDRIRRKPRINANVGLKYELVQEYKNNLRVDRHGSIPNLMIAHSNLNVFKSSFELCPKKQPMKENDERVKRLYSTSKTYDQYGAIEIADKYCHESVESYEKIKKAMERLKVVSIRLDLKYGGDKFFLVFYNEFMKRIQGTVLTKYIVMKNDMEYMCPGINLIFNCTANLALAKLLHSKHRPLRIFKEDYDLFKDIFISTIQDEFYFTETDFEYINWLVKILCKDIIVKK